MLGLISLGRSTSVGGNGTEVVPIFSRRANGRQGEGREFDEGKKKFVGLFIYTAVLLLVLCVRNERFYYLI